MLTNDDPHFKSFCEIVTKHNKHTPYSNKKKSKKDTELFNLRQRDQVHRLHELEAEWKRELIKSGLAEEVYQSFFYDLNVVRRDVRSASPMFREPAEVISHQINVKIKESAWRGMLQYHVNFLFMKRVTDLVPKLRKNKEIHKIYLETERHRDILIVENIPLALYEVRRFSKVTPQSELEYMDLVQAAVQGVAKGVDKWRGPYSTVFRSTILAQTKSFLMNLYTDPMLRFPQKERVQLYRAHKYIAYHPEWTYEEVSDHLGEEEEYEIDPEALAQLLAAVTVVSSDVTVPGEETTVSNRFEAPDFWSPDHDHELDDGIKHMLEKAKELSVFEQKLLQLKGISL